MVCVCVHVYDVEMNLLSLLARSTELPSQSEEFGDPKHYATWTLSHIRRMVYHGHLFFRLAFKLMDASAAFLNTVAEYQSTLDDNMFAGGDKANDRVESSEELEALVVKCFRLQAENAAAIWSGDTRDAALTAVVVRYRKCLMRIMSFEGHPNMHVGLHYAEQADVGALRNWDTLPFEQYHHVVKQMVQATNRRNIEKDAMRRVDNAHGFVRMIQSLPVDCGSALLKPESQSWLRNRVGIHMGDEPGLDAELS